MYIINSAPFSLFSALASQSLLEEPPEELVLVVCERSVPWEDKSQKQPWKKLVFCKNLFSIHRKIKGSSAVVELILQ